MEAGVFEIAGIDLGEETSTEELADVLFVLGMVVVHLVDDYKGDFVFGFVG